jgi:transposase
MSKHFRPWKIDQPQLLPPSVQDFVPREHLSRFIVELVRESLDLGGIIGSYTSALGQPPFDPRLMVALLLNGYASGIYSSRRIARACVERADFMMISALDAPDFRTICEFRKRHLNQLAGLFVQVLKLAEKAGLVRLGHVALDGTKVKANASKNKAMSYGHMKKRQAELQAEVDRWLAAAEAADAEEDGLYGNKRGDELPDWVADKEKRSQGLRRPRLNSRPRRRLRPTRSAGSRRRSRSAARPRTARRPASPPHRRRRSLPRRHSATSLIPKAAFSKPRMASSKAITRRQPSMAKPRSSLPTL